MHRSGTSAVTGLLNQFGVFPGQNLLPANSANPKGFFESQSVVDINNAILQAFGSSWDDLSRLPDNWWCEPVAVPIKNEITAFLSSLTGTHELSVIKDPRLCKTLPLWLVAMEQLYIEPIFILCVRHPSAVAQSEKIMKGLSFLQSLVLYIEYGLLAEMYTRPYSRFIVSYTELLTDWVDVIRSINQVLQLGFSDDVEIINERGNDFISPELNRSEQGDQEAFLACGILAKLAMEAFDALQRDDLCYLDGLRTRFSEYRQDMEPWMALLQHVKNLEQHIPFKFNGEQRYFYSKLKCKLSWGETLEEDFNTTNHSILIWSPANNKCQQLRVRLTHSSVVEKIRLQVVNYPALISFHKLFLMQNDVVVCQWGKLKMSLIDHAKTAFDLSNSEKKVLAKWLFLDKSGYIDLKLPEGNSLALDDSHSLVMEVEIKDVSMALQPLINIIVQSRKELSQLRKVTRKASVNSACDDVDFKRASDMTEKLHYISSVLPNVLLNRDTMLSKQNHRLCQIREDLIRAEAQLDLLKDIVFSGPKFG